MERTGGNKTNVNFTVDFRIKSIEVWYLFLNVEIPVNISFSNYGLIWQNVFGSFKRIFYGRHAAIMKRKMNFEILYKQK